MPTRRTTRERALAAEAWGRLQGFLLANRHRFVDLAASMGLTPGEMHALLSLDVDEPKAMRGLAEDWRCDASNVTWLVDRLEDRGLAERRTSASDRRVKTVMLTPEGRRAQERLRQRLGEPPAELLELSVDDLEALCRAMRNLTG